MHRKPGVLLTLLCLAGLAGAAAAETWTVKVKALNGRAAYSHAQALAVGKQASFAGRPQMRGGGPAREMIFNAFLNAPEGGLFRLDYQAELAGANKARPPFQAAGKALLRPGKPLLAAEAGGWKLILELAGTAEGKAPRGGTGVLETSLKCGRASYPASFAYLPEEQYSAVLYAEAGETVTRYMVGLLPNLPGVDGAFLLQYTLLLKEGAENLAEGQGELILAPGGGKRSVAAGKDCVFSAKALR